MLRLFAKLLKALNAEGSPSQVSFGFTFGMMVGLVPLWSLSNLIVFFIVCVFRINVSAFIVAWVFFSGIAYLLDPTMEHLGAGLLTAQALSDMWTTFYASDFMRLAHFNNTLVLGAFITSFVLFIPFFFISNFLVKKYRDHLLAWVRKSRLMQLIKANKFYDIYRGLSGGVA